MVPLSEARHRIYQSEMSEVVEGLRLRLEEHLQDKDNPEDAEIGFRVLYRFIEGIKGRPKYPEFDWSYLEYYLDIRVPKHK